MVRTLTPSQVKGDFYPQSPMQIKIGSWSGGDPANEPGVIKWAKGPTDYSKGPFDMIVKTIKVQDYSTGKFYYYADKSGSASSIVSDGGRIMLGPNNSPGNAEIPAPEPAEIPTTTPRAPSNSGRITSSTTTSTESTSTPSHDDKDDKNTDDQKTIPPPTTTTTTSYGYITSSTDSISTIPELIGTGTRTIIIPRNTSLPHATNTPIPTDAAAPRLGVSMMMALVGVVGVWLVL